MAQTNDNAYLAKLKTQRAALDTLIANIEAYEKSGIIPAGGGQGNAGGGPVDIQIDTFIGLTVLDGAKKYLNMCHKSPKSTQEILDALGQGGLKSTMTSVATILGRDGRAGRGSIKAVGRGMWGLREWYPNASAGKRKRSVKKEEEEITSPKTVEIEKKTKKAEEA